MTARTVLVTDGEQRAALAVTRSLGRAGHRVHVCSSSGRSLAGASRFAAADHAIPGALGEPEGFADALWTLARDTGADVLLPITDAAALAILPVRERFAGVAIPFPSADAFRAVSDRTQLRTEAAAVGIAFPKSTVLRAPTDLTRELAEGLAYPLVVKPARSVVDGGTDGGPRGKYDVRYAPAATALPGVLARFGREAYPLLLQQRVVGPGIGIFLLLWGNRRLAVFAHRRLREMPPSGGYSVYSESISADPLLVDRSEALLRRFAWEGVAMVEFKLDSVTRVPYLMEVNGRFWGSLQLAVDAGVDFPTLLIDAAAGGAPRPVSSYRLGQRNRWWWGDVNHLLTRWRRPAEELALPPGAPGRLAVAAGFLAASVRRGRNEILRLDDPAPAVRETLAWLRGA